MKVVEAARERLAAKHARKIRGALAATVNVERLVRDWESSHPVEGITPEQARAWVKIHTIPADKELSTALRFAYADAWALGALSAAQLVNRLKKKTKAASPELSPINWDNWTPGERAAAALLKPPGGLQILLASRMTVIKDINNTTYDRLGTQLSTAMAQGLTNDQTAALLEGVMNDPARSLMIARTETARASSVAARNLYETSGVEYVEWLVAEGCDDCKENEDASPIPIDATFPSGDSEPPAHPNCMCSLAPYVVDTQGIGGENLDNSFTPSDEGGVIGEDLASVTELTPETIMSQAGLNPAMPYAWNPTSKYETELLSKEHFTQALKDMKIAAESPLSMRIDDKALMKVLEDGQFKPANEVKSHFGSEFPVHSTYLDARSKLENDLWGIPKETTQPIYGYMSTPREINVPSVDMYGSIKIILKDLVKDRTTITASDSLNHRLTPILIKDILEEKVDNKTLSSAIYQPEHWVSGAHDYFEAQIHGGVLVSDIQKVVILKTQKNHVTELLDILKTLGIEVEFR